MKDKVNEEYKKFIQKNLTQVEKDYLNAINVLEKKAKAGGNQ